MYEDILNLPHHVSKTRPQMSMLDRAAQFSPFAALTGYDDAIIETGRLTDEKIEMDEDRKAALLERVVNPVFTCCTLKGLDVSIGHFDVADSGILLHEMLNGLLTLISLRLRGCFLRLLNFLHELLESFFQHFAGDLAALDSDSNNFGIYFILHGDLLSETSRVLSRS